MKAITVSNLRANLRKHFDDVSQQDEIIVIPRNNKEEDAIVVMSIKDYNSMTGKGYLSAEKKHSKKLMTIDHIGIAVKDLEESLTLYRNMFGFHSYHYEEIEDQQVRVHFIKVGDQKLELIEGMSPESPIKKFIEKRGAGIHHIAYKVDDIITTLEALKEKGYRLIDQQPRKGAMDKWIAFIHPKDTQGVLIELCQPMEQT